MQLSTRGRYAVMAMVELARRDAACPVTLTDIAASQQLSLCYLEQLFGGLRRAGLVVSARGPGGGYRLARPADVLAIADILDAVDELLRATRCHPGEAGCLDGAMCGTHDLWLELGRQIRLFMTAVTLADVVQGRVRSRAAELVPAGPVGMAQ